MGCGGGDIERDWTGGAWAGTETAAAADEDTFMNEDEDAEGESV